MGGGCNTIPQSPDAGVKTPWYFPLIKLLLLWMRLGRGYWAGSLKWTYATDSATESWLAHHAEISIRRVLYVVV
jgi:hypothetical protein